MSVETELRAAMADAVAPAHPDTDRLVSVARRRGLGIRRRRQVLGSVGVAAALGLAILAPNVVAGDRGRHVPAPMVVGTQPRSFDGSATSPITGRSTDAGLLYAVGLEATGTATDFRGQGDGKAVDGGLVMTYAGFTFTPAGSSTGGDVGMNVQYVPPESQAKPEKRPHMRCADDADIQQCRITHLADGSVLRTSLQRSPYGDRTGMMWTADLARADHVRVVAFATNGLDVSERDEKITRAEPVLTVEQLTRVVTQPWWGTQLPTYFRAQGEQLEPYNEIGGAAQATPSSSPTP